MRSSPGWTALVVGALSWRWEPTHGLVAAAAVLPLVFVATRPLLDELTRRLAGIEGRASLVMIASNLAYVMPGSWKNPCCAPETFAEALPFEWTIGWIGGGVLTARVTAVTNRVARVADGGRVHEAAPAADIDRKYCHGITTSILS